METTRPRRDPTEGDQNPSTRQSERACWAGLAAAAAAAALVVLTAAQASPTRSTGPTAGGTYRVAFEQSFGFTDGFDPTGDYYTFSFEIFSNLMIRTLVGYNHVAGPAGNVLVPDIATAVPKPTNGGKTYTFHLKQGVKFGPPVDRPVTSKDVLYAMERIAHPKDGAEYGFYYTPIVGFAAYGAGKAKTIAGIKTPNPSTIVFNLTKPVGDFLYRMAMPATGPIPVEVAKCFEGQAGRYGKDVVSTGPYMISGADKVDGSSCAKLQPMSGFDGISKISPSSATPSTTRGQTLRRRGRTSPTSSSSRSIRTRATSSTASLPDNSRTRTDRARRRRRSRSTRARRSGSTCT